MRITCSGLVMGREERVGENTSATFIGVFSIFYIEFTTSIIDHFQST